MFLFRLKSFISLLIKFELINKLERKYLIDQKGANNRLIGVVSQKKKQINRRSQQQKIESMDDLPLPATTNSMFDQQPIGNSSKMMLDQYPADFDPSKIQAKPQPLPISKRLASKVWKVRKQALEQLLKMVTSQSHQQFNQHQPTIIKLLSDSNIQCQYISAKILFQYLQKQQSYSGQVKLIIKSVIQKLMTIQKQDIQNLALEIQYWLVDHGCQELLMNQLNDYLLNKNPKIISASLKSIQFILNSYGIRKLQGLQLFNKHLKLLADAARPMAKPQTVQLFKEVFKWTGEQLLTTFVIHPQVKEQLMKWAKTYQMQPMEIKRGLKKGQQGKKINPMQEEQQSDTPVDILHHFDSRWVDTVLEIQKWQEKKQYLQEFIKKTKVGAIVPRQTSHYITLIKRLFSENNINLLQCGFKIVKNLCKGLKKAFAISCKSFLSYVYLKLKDNKAMIVDQTLSTLKIMIYSITLEDMQEQIKLGLKDKSPQMRLNTLKLLKEFSSKKDNKTTRILKSLIDSLVALTNDSASDVRDIALSVLCKIKEHYGMIFFQDKLQSLPAKKVNQIRSTPTIGLDENEGSKMEIEETGLSNMMRSNIMSETSIRGLPKQTKPINQKKKPLQSSSQPHLSTNYNNKQVSNKPLQPVIQKKTSISQPPSQTIMDKKQQQQQSISQMSVIREQRVYRVQRSQEAEMMQVRNEQWPIVPTPGHVLRLINLFTKLGEPFLTLATPFKLKISHFQLLQNCDANFMAVNADLILKWVLWRIQIQNSDITEKLLSVIIHLVFILKNNITNDQTVLILSNISSLLQSDFWSHDMLKYINTQLMDLSVGLREKMFNFWISALNSSSCDIEYCGRILQLMRNTFYHEGFSCEQICAMARTQAILKNKRFVSYLFQSHNRQLLKVSGFSLQQLQVSQQQQLVLKQSEPQFSINMPVHQRMAYFQIFKHNSNQCIQQIRNLQQSVPKHQIMLVHIKLMQTIMVPYITQKIQPINVYNYFKIFTNRVTYMCEPKINETEFITPHLRNLMRLTIFFLIDLSESKLDNKDQLIRNVNKIILVFLERLPAEHLLEVMTMLLRYSLKNNLHKRLAHILIKCINKSTKNPSFIYKTQKNIKLLFNFFVQLIDQCNINDDQNLIRSIKTLFSQLMANYKELCSQIVIQKLNQYAPNGFKCKQIESVFRNFIAFMNRNEDQSRKLGDKINEGNMKIDSKIVQNYQSMSNLQQNLNLSAQNYQNNIVKGQQSVKIRQATNIHRKSQPSYNNNPKIQATKLPTVLDLAQNNDMGTKILQQRRRLQNYQGLYQSWEGLVKMKQEISAGNIDKKDIQTIAVNNQDMTI